MTQDLKNNSALLLDLYELTMAQGYWKAKKDSLQATFAEKLLMRFRTSTLKLSFRKYDTVRCV